MTERLREELLALGVGEAQMHGRFTPRGIAPRHRFGPNVEAQWQPSTSEKALEVTVSGGPSLELKYVGHQLGAKVSRIGRLYADGLALEVTERWDEVSVTNGGTYLRDGERTSTTFCCDELVRAAEEGNLQLVPDGGGWSFEATWSDDVVWHDLDQHRSFVRLEVDLSAGKARLRRLGFHDTSQ